MDESEFIDWWQLERLLTRYARACDDRDWAAYREVFSADALIDYTQAGGRCGKPDDILPWLQQIMNPATLPSTQHMLSNFTAEVRGVTATGRADYFNPDVLLAHGKRSGLFNGGVYRFTARRVDGEWRLVALSAQILWSTRAELCAALQ